MDLIEQNGRLNPHSQTRDRILAILAGFRHCRCDEPQAPMVVVSAHGSFLSTTISQHAHTQCYLDLLEGLPELRSRWSDGICLTGRQSARDTWPDAC